MLDLRENDINNVFASGEKSAAQSLSRQAFTLRSGGLSQGMCGLIATVTLVGTFRKHVGATWLLLTC